MTEIKAPLNLRIKNFILGHVHLFLVIIFIALAVLFSSCGTAKAAEADFPSNLEDVMTEDINAHAPNYLTAYLNVLRNTVYPNCNSVTRYETEFYIGYVFYDNSKFTGMYGYSVDDIKYYIEGFSYEFISFSSATVTNNGAYSLGISKTQFNQDTAFVYQYLNGGWGAGGSLNNKTYSNLAGTYSETVSLNYKVGSGGRLYTNYLAGYNSSIVVSGNTITSFIGNNKYYIWNSTANTGLVNDDWSTVYPEAVEDDRLKIYTINDNTGKDVVFDLDDFDFSNYDGSAAETQNTLLNNQIVVTVDYDGTDQVITLDSTNSDILPAYLVKTPLSYFNVDGYDNVKVTKVEFSKLIHYRPSEMKPDDTENYKIACEYYLKKYVEPIEKGDNQFQDDLNGDKLTQSEINDIYYTIHFSDGAGISFDDYELAPPEGYSVYTVYLKNTVSNWEDFIEDWEITVREFYYLVLGSYNTQSSVEEYISEWLVANKAALYWDVIEFEWIQEDNSSLTRTYWYYTTESGRIRSISNVLADMYIQGNDIKVNTAAIFTSIDNFETESLEFFNDQLGFNSDAIEWFRSINNSVNSGFTSVVNAINSLDFTVPDYDDTDILDKLDDIITAISGIGTNENEIDTPQECIDFYIDNIDKDINDIEFELRPAYYEGMTLYILYSFDVDDNYSDDVQRASIRGTKASNPITDSENILVKVIITLRDTFTSSDAHNVINSTLKDMNGRSNYYTQLFESDYDCQEWEGLSYD